MTLIFPSEPKYNRKHSKGIRHINASLRTPPYLFCWDPTRKKIKNHINKTEFKKALKANCWGIGRNFFWFICNLIREFCFSKLLEHKTSVKALKLCWICIYCPEKLSLAHTSHNFIQWGFIFKKSDYLVWREMCLLPQFRHRTAFLSDRMKYLQEVI